MYLKIYRLMTLAYIALFGLIRGPYTDDARMRCYGHKCPYIGSVHCFNSSQAQGETLWAGKSVLDDFEHVAQSRYGVGF